MEANFKLIVLGLFFSNFVCFARPFDQSDYAEELDYLTKSRPTKFRDHRRFDEHRKPRQDDKGTDKIVKFQYFHCDDKQLRDRLVELKYLTLYKGEMYFYFKFFVIKLQLPEFYLKEESGSYHLIYPEPVYSEYKPMSTPPTLLEWQDITAFMQVIYSTQNMTFVLREHYNTRVQPPKQYFKLIYELRYRPQIVGELIYSYPGLTDRVHKKAFSLGFVRWDRSKWFEISYDPLTNNTQIFFELFEGYDYRAELRQQQHYKTTQLIYYELADGSLRLWSGTLIEIDALNTIHFSNYVFTLTESNILQVQSVDHMALPMFDFFDCVREIRVHHPQFKGVFVKEMDAKSSKWRTYLFIDNYYLVIDFDLVSLGFAIFSETKWDPFIRKIEFTDPDENLKRERATTKWLKHLQVDQVYLTFNPRQTHKLTFKEMNDKVSEDQIIATGNSLLVHACTQAILTIDGVSFCFEKQHYYYKSDNGFRGVQENTQKYSVSGLFDESSASLNGEPVDYIMNYGAEKVLFMTLNYLTIFKKNVFAVKPIARPANSDYQLELIVKNLTSEQYVRKWNCLWMRCSYSLLDLDDVKDNRKFELYEIMDEQGFPLKNDTDLDTDMLELTRLTPDELATLAKGSLTKNDLTKLYKKYMPE